MYRANKSTESKKNYAQLAQSKEEPSHPKANQPIVRAKPSKLTLMVRFKRAREGNNAKKRKKTSVHRNCTQTHGLIKRPGENPKRKGQNKGRKGHIFIYIDEVRRPSSQHHYSRSTSGVLLLSPAVVRTLTKEKLSDGTPSQWHVIKRKNERRHSTSSADVIT